jgi:hypothetical protein
MPTKKRGLSRKNLPPEERDDRVIPTKENTEKKPLRSGKDKVAPKRVTALATQGKKKKPK